MLLFSFSFQIVLFLFLGMKYLIKPLEAFCVNLLLEHLEEDDSNLFTILQFCVDCEVDKRLMEKCMTMLRDNPPIWGFLPLRSKSFLKINHKCLMLLLDDDFLEAQEIALFNAVCFCLFFQF